MQAFGITVLLLISAGSAPAEPTAPADAATLEEAAAANDEEEIEEELALEEGSEADFFAEEEEEEVFTDNGDAELAQTDQPAFGPAFPEHDPRRGLLLLPLALLALFTLNVRWRTPSK